MKNLKKVGLTALAGSLAAVSANAAELSVSGGATLTYVSEEHSVVASNNGGNAFGMNNGMSFTGTGEAAGMDVTYFNTISDTGTISSSRITLGMGDMGTVYFDQGVGGNGITAIDDSAPIAFEEPTDGMDGAATGLAGGGATNTFGYKNTVAGIGLAINFDPRVGDSDTSDGATDTAGTGSGSGWSALVTLPELVEGLAVRVGYGSEVIKDGTTTGNDKESAGADIKYTMGPITAGYYANSTTGGDAGTASNEREGYGVVFSVNENLSLSYTVNDNEYGKAGSAHVTEESTGIAVAYTMGGATLVVQQNDQDNGGGTSGKTEERTEINLSFAF